VDFINSARKDGLPLQEAVVQGGKLRLRPVILTTVTTIAGLLPMGLGVFGAEEFLQPMALAIVWGLLFSTILTLLLVPSIYMLIDAIRRTFWRGFHAIFPKNETEDKEVGA
jgi:HAE1 family hydrophobic/amphiphilic exporter-1